MKPGTWKVRSNEEILVFFCLKNWLLEVGRDLFCRGTAGGQEHPVRATEDTFLSEFKEGLPH